MTVDVQKMQDLYGRWVTLLPELENGLRQWREAAEIIKRLQQFYYDENWVRLHDEFDQSLLNMNGNYSVLSEDALWNAFSEQHHLAIRWIKQAVSVLEPEEG